jgi:hypothetical protein
MAKNWVICIYKPHEGKEDEFKSLIGRHYTTLREQSLVTNRPPIVMRSGADGIYLELFQWESAAAASDAHENKHVMEIWGGLGACADVLTLKSLKEAEQRFPHFEDASDLVA